MAERCNRKLLLKRLILSEVNMASRLHLLVMVGRSLLKSSSLMAQSPAFPVPAFPVASAQFSLSATFLLLSTAAMVQ